MKKIFFIAFMLLTSAFIVFTGCKPEEETPTGPSLSLMAGTGYITANATVEPGDTVKFKWTATKGTTGEDAKLASFTIKIEGQPATDVNNKSWNAAAVSNDETYVDEAAFWVGSNEGTKLFSLTITDKDGLYKELTVTITIEQQVVNTPIDSYLNKTLVSAYNASTTNTQYIDALTGTLYNHTASGAASNATFGFVSGGSGNGACIFTSDNDLTLSQQPTGWATGAQLTTTTLTTTQFDNITYEEDLLPLMPGTISGTKVNLLQDGETNAGVTVIAFIVNGKKGLIKLPESMNNGADQSISVSIKVQQ